MTKTSTKEELRNSILACEEYHVQLVADIADLEYADTKRDFYHAIVIDLGQKLPANYQKVAAWAVENLKASVGRRLFATLGVGKRGYVQKLQEAESKWHEAVQAEIYGREALEELEMIYNDATKQTAILQEKIEKKGALKRELLALFAQLFDGPTPGYPEEDRLETSILKLGSQKAACEAAAEEERTAVDLLQRAWNATNTVMSKLDAFTVTAAQGKGSSSPLKEMIPMVAEARTLVSLALATCPRVEPSPDVGVPGSSSSSDASFDQLASEALLEENVEKFANKIRLVHVKVEELCATSAVRRNLADEALKAVADEYGRQGGAASGLAEIDFQQYHG